MRLNNNAGWLYTYREQFGHDILPTLMPAMSAILDIAKGVIESVEPDSIRKKGEKIEIPVEAIIEIADSQGIADSLIHISGLEAVELINITWALAKTADEGIKEPKLWIRDFETFPVDEVAPEIFKLISTGVVSSKNLKRLKTLMESIQPSTSTPSQSEPSSEDSPSET